MIEMLAVLVLIGLAAGIVAVNVRSYMIKGKQNVARSEIATLASSLEAYYIAYSRFPSNEEGLDILTQISDEIPAPLMDRVPVDPWGHRYQYNQPGSNSQPYEVFSYGADGREGGEAADKDIRSDDQRKEAP